MNPSDHVKQQAFATLSVSVVAVVLTGQPATLALAILLSTFAVLGCGFGAAYGLRVWRYKPLRSMARASDDRVMIGCLVAGYLVPTALLWLLHAADVLPSPELTGSAAVFGACVAVSIPAAILASSCVDWYLILPFVRGVFGVPICQMGPDSDVTRRAYAKYWIFHRGLAEIAGWGGLAIFVSVAATAAALSAGDNPIIGQSLSFLPAAAILGYVAVKVSGAVEFFFTGRLALGDEVNGRTSDCSDVEGMVVDVSIVGVGVLESPGQGQRTIPLAHCSSATTDRHAPRRCETKCEGWVVGCEQGARVRDETQIRGETQSLGDVEH